MALNLASGAALVASQSFQQRVAMAFYVVARQVLMEDLTIYGHEQRVNFARSIILQDYTRFLQYAAMVATDKAIVDGGPYVAADLGTNPPDERITAAVSGMWNWLASVPPPRP